MIRVFRITDMESVLDVWLLASIKAHDFAEPDFWISQLENMRSIYIPASEAYVYEKDQKVVGFYALFGEKLAAIFVNPNRQGAGIGRSLVNHAKSIRSALNLTVYKANSASVGFYQSQVFLIIEERRDCTTGQEEYGMLWAANGFDPIYPDAFSLLRLR